jgi:hypothetical protein
VDEQYLPCMVRLADWCGTGACSLVQLEGYTFSLASQRQHEPWGSVGEDFSETVMVGTEAMYTRPNRGCGTDIAYRLHLTRVLPHRARRNGAGCCAIQARDHNARRPTVMIIKSATRLAFAAGCLAAIAILPPAHAQMGAPGGYGYGTPPAGYGYGPPPAPYGYGPPQGAYPPPGAYGYGSPPGAYTPQSQYVAPPPAAATAGKQLITNGPQTNPGDVSSSPRRSGRTVRIAAGS